MRPLTYAPNPQFKLLPRFAAVGLYTQAFGGSFNIKPHRKFIRFFNLW
jgi:hypothetical protein